MVTVSVHQPNFMPWLKLMAKVLDSDVYVAYDGVQFTHQEFHARQLFRTRARTTAWLTVPVLSTGARQILKDVRIAENGWRDTHLACLENNYSQAPCFDQVFPLIRAVYARGHDMLVDHNLDLLAQFSCYLGSAVTIIKASSLKHAGSREERLLSLVRNAGGDARLTSTAHTHLIDWTGFVQAGIPVYHQLFDHPVYPQGTGVVTPNLSIVDLLFHAGKTTAEILATSGHRELRPAPRKNHEQPA